MNKGFIINKDFNPQILRTVLRRNWWVILISLGLCYAVAFLYLRYTKPVYESSMLLQLDNKDRAKELIDLENVNNKTNSISSEIELLKSQLLFEKAIGRMNLNVSLYSRGQVLTEEKYISSSFNVQPYALYDSSLINVPVYIHFDGKTIRANYRLNGREFSDTASLNDHMITPHFDIVVKSPDPELFLSESEENELYFIFNSVSSLSARMLGNLSVFPVDMDAKTIQISYKSYNSLLSYDVVNAVAESFFDYDEERKRKSSENILSFIDQQLDSLSVELKNSKDSLMAFQRNSNLPDPELAGTSFSENIDKLQDQLFSIEEELSTLRMVNSKLNSEPNRLEIYRLLPEMLGKSYEMSLSKQIADLHALLERKEDLLFEVTEENSEVKAINTKIQLKIQSIRRSISVIEDRLSSNFRLINDKIASIEGKYYALPRQKMEFSRLKNIQELNEKYVTLLTEKRVQYAISDAGYASSNRILNKPSVSFTPSSPNKKLIYALFVFLGFFIALVILLFKYLTFNEINSVDDLKKLLPENTGILGVVPHVNGVGDYSQLVVFDSPKSVLAESLRNIRANLNFISPDAQTIAVSSTISGEGKTFVVLNLGGILALSGKRTVIVDLDLRKPKVHLGFDHPNQDGISNLIIGQTTLDACIRKTDNDKLDFITAGPIPPNPSELLLNKRFEEVVMELKKRYDMIIFDNPPIGLVSDGVKILAEADIPVYVFKSHYSRRNFTQLVRELYTNQRISNLNVILNGTKRSRNDAYGYGYGYGYSAGYYENEEENKRKSRRKK